jgi:hypothetical protein
MLRKNNSENYEKLCSLTLTKEKFPIAFENKVKEIMQQEKVDRLTAEKWVQGMEIELELYYQPEYGLFAVESEAVESNIPIYSPYTAEELEDFDE